MNQTGLRPQELADVAEATAAVLREVHRFYDVAGLSGTSSPLARAWEFYVAAADVAGVRVPSYGC